MVSDNINYVGGIKLIHLLLIIIHLSTIITVEEEKVIPRVVVDLDPGVDDAYALLMFLNAEKTNNVKVEAIVCSVGNSNVDNTCRNVVRVLELLNRTDIPLYKGASQHIVPLRDFQGLDFFGKDGFGDVEANANPDLSIIREVPASIALNDIVTKSPKQITLVSLGPLTTTALTMLLFKDFSSKLKDIWIMGGNFAGPGNIGDDAEFNFFLDPESANIVLHNSVSPVSLLTWETCIAVGTTLDWRFNVLGNKKSAFIDFFNEIEQKVYANMDLNTGWYECDAFTAIAVLHSQSIIETNSVNAKVELYKEKSRGKLVRDHIGKSANVTILEKLDANFVKNALLNAV